MSYMSHVEQLTPQPPEWTIEDRLVKARTHAHLERADLAPLLGISTKSIQRLELGQITPKRGTVIAWAFACNVPVDWLLTGETNPTHGGPAPTGPTGRYGEHTTSGPIHLALAS